MLLLMLNCFGRIFLTERRIVQKNYVITISYLVAMIFFSRMDSSFVNSIAGIKLVSWCISDNFAREYKRYMTMNLLL